MLIKKKALVSIGMMDAKYFVYGDDTHFMLRSHKAHLSLFCEPTALLYHKVSSLTGGTKSPFMVHLLARNRVYFSVKNRLKSASTLKIQLNAMLDGFRLI